MGLSYSTPDEKTNTTNKVENVRRLFNVNEHDDFFSTLNMTESGFVDNHKKLPLPIIGGTNNLGNQNSKLFESLDFDLIGGANKSDLRFMPKRRRYLKHNIFKVLSQIDEVNKKQKGGNNEDEQYLSTSSDDEAIKNIKNIILKEVQKLDSDVNNQLGGDCGCEGKKSSNDQLGGAKKKSKSKGKGKGKGIKGGKSKAKKHNDSSSSSSSSSSDDDSYYQENKESSLQSNSNSSDENTTENVSSSEEASASSQKGGLSIFPFNSSEIKTSQTEKKNSRMIRRKI